MTYLYIPVDILNRKRRTIFLFLLYAAVFFCFYSCVSNFAVKKKRPFAYLTNNSKYILLPSVGIEKPMESLQLLSASYDGQNYFLNAWVKADNEGIHMILLNELGTNVGELAYRDGTVNFSSAVFPKSISPEYIVADFQLCFYNVHALNQALKNCGLSLKSENNNRLILQGNTVIIEIEKSQNSVRLFNRLRGYAYTLEGDF
jgi:hypothetical protein